MASTEALRRSSRVDPRGNWTPLNRFERLFEVGIQHGYFPTLGGPLAGSDLRPNAGPAGLEITPTPSTEELFASSGLLFRAEPSSFSVLYQARPLRQRLFTQIRQRLADQDPMHMGFVFGFQDPLFTNYTELPRLYQPTTSALYVTNYRDQKAPDRDVPVAGIQLLDIRSSKFRVRFRDGDHPANRIWVFDIFGHRVQCYKRHGDEGSRYVDLSELPFGKYWLVSVYVPPYAEKDECYKERTEDGEFQGWEAILYLSWNPTPLGLIDVVLAPRDYTPGPVKLTGTSQSSRVTTALPLELPLMAVRFDARELYYAYLIVMPGDSFDYPYDELRIVDETGIIKFGSPERSVFQDRYAWAFCSRSKHALAQSPPYRLRLSGRDRRTGGRQRVVIADPLPLPGPEHLERENVFSLRSTVYFYINPS